MPVKPKQDPIHRPGKTVSISKGARKSSTSGIATLQLGTMYATREYNITHYVKGWVVNDINLLLG